MMASVSIVISFTLVAVVISQEYQPFAAGIAADRCFEPVSTGHCRARFPSFHYNPLTETCDCFIFGGCGANGNKFATLDDCMNTCGVNPQLQTISSTCISIFGTENSKLTVTPRRISSRPVVFSLNTNPHSAVIANHVGSINASPSEAAPTDAATVTSSSTNAPATADPSTHAQTIAAQSTQPPTTVSPSTEAPATAASSTEAQTTASSSTEAPTTVSSSKTSVTRKPASSTAGPWDHWFN